MIMKTPFDNPGNSEQKWILICGSIAGAWSAYKNCGADPAKCLEVIWERQQQLLGTSTPESSPARDEQ